VRRGGFTFLELLVALVIAGIVVTALIGLFKAALTSTRFTLRQTFVLSNARKALVGDGSHRGIIWGIQESTSTAVSLSPTSLNLLLSSSSLNYALSGEILNKTQSGTTYPLAKGLSDIEVKYYAMDSNGLIMVAPSTDTAMYVTAAFTLRGRLMKETTFYLYSGAWLRNK
jgi:prepilin-type N-terminal cleavage/methylation domain-containing protein